MLTGYYGAICKRIALFSIAITALALLLTACGSGGGGGASPLDPGIFTDKGDHFVGCVSVCIS